jgi:hypothetical protein
MVVYYYVCCKLCLRHGCFAALGNSSPLVGLHYYHPPRGRSGFASWYDNDYFLSTNLILIIVSRYRCGYYESTDWTQHYYRDDSWLQVSYGSVEINSLPTFADTCCRIPGRPIATILFKSWGYMLSYNGLQYVQDMKTSHYMKIPLRYMFAAQCFAVIWLSFIQITTYKFLRGNLTGICTADQAQGLTCPGAHTFYNASVICGIVVS